MRTSKFITAAAIAGTATLALAAPIVSASAPPDSDYAFLQTAAIDEIVGGAENASANCAALETVGGLMFIIGIMSMSPEDTETTELGSHPAELLIASAAPALVPLLERTTPPADAAWAEALDTIAAELRATIDELGTLGLTDDDLLMLQTEWVDDSSDAMSSDSEPATSIPDEIPPQFQALLDHDFESITFLDPDSPVASTGSSGLENLWGDECPETAGMFSFDMEPIDVEMDFSVTVGGSEPVTEMNVTVNGSEVPVDSATG